MTRQLLREKISGFLPSTGLAPMWGKWPGASDYNTHNYRGSELEIKPQSRLLIISVGCSFVFGPYLKAEECFHSIIANRIEAIIGGPVTLWNLGAVGGSNDYIARTCVQVVEKYQRYCPILALVSFTVPDRREYIDAIGEIFPYLPCETRQHVRFPHQQTLDTHLTNLISQYDDYLRFYRNYKLIEYCFRASGVEWFYTHLPQRSAVYEMAAGQFLDHDRFVGPFPCVDSGIPEDPGHPGPKSNIILADRMWGKIVSIVSKWENHDDVSHEFKDFVAQNP